MSHRVEEHILSMEHFTSEDGERFVKVLWSSTGRLADGVVLFTTAAYHYAVPGVKEVLDTAAVGMVKCMMASVVGSEVKVMKVDEIKGGRH